MHPMHPPHLMACTGKVPSFVFEYCACVIARENILVKLSQAGMENGPGLSLDQSLV